MPAKKQEDPFPWALGGIFQNNGQEKTGGVQKGVHARVSKNYESANLV
jgi:hypothetical protein